MNKTQHYGDMRQLKLGKYGSYTINMSRKRAAEI